MSQQDSMTSVPVVEFDPRTGKPLFSAQYYKDTEQQYKDYDTGDKQAIGKSAPSGTVKRGAWLSSKLQNLYNDPKFKNATPEQQKEWKGLAYDKWVTPYYQKVMKASPPTKEEWITKNFQHYNEGTGVKDNPIEGVYNRVGKEVLGHTLKTTADIAGGLAHNLAYAGKAIDYIAGQDDYKPGEKNAEQTANAVGDFFDKRSKIASDYLEEVHNVQHGQKPALKDDVPGKIAELGTQAVFFEATGAAKVAKAFTIVNPKTAALATQMAKASWNGAVEFGMWNASQGEKPEDIGKGAAAGAILGPGGKLLQRKGTVALNPLAGIFKDLFKWGGTNAAKSVVEDVLTRVEKNEQILGEVKKEGSALSIQGKQASAFARVALDNYSKAKFGDKTFDQLSYIQRQHVLNKMLSFAAQGSKAATEEGMPKQLIQAQAKEEDARIAEIFPEAKTSQAKIDQFVKEHGEPQVQTKLLASLPHHNTTADSSWQHLQARASFLKAQLRRAKEGSPEYKDLKEALGEEYKLMKEKSAKQKGTVGSAAANDPRAFKGNYVVTPNIDPYNTGFGEWKTDTFAQGVAQLARQQAGAKGSAKSFITDAIDNATMVGANLSKKAFLQEGTTKQLFHPQYGLVGGINWQMEKAYNLGENSGFKGSDPVLFINWLGMRPNVVARVWPVKGGGQTLFLNAAMEANRTGSGIALTPFDASKSFYEKMGMREVGSYMAMTHKEVQTLLRNKGLLMMLLGVGITYGAHGDLVEGDYSVRGKN